MLDKHLIAKTQPVAVPENIVSWKDIRVSVLTPTLFRVEKNEKGSFCDKATQGIWFRNTPAVKFSVAEKEDGLCITTDKATLCVKADVMKSTVTVDGNEVTLRSIKNLPGAYRTLDRCDGKYYLEKDNETWTPIKLDDGVVSECGVGIYDDAKTLILEEDGRLYARDDDTADLYVFAHGKDYRGALRDLYTVSGRVPVIPRYALGNWWSRYHAYTEKEYLHILDKLADRNVPLTVATIDMDWHWSTTLDERKGITESGKNDDFHGGAKGWTGYSWNTDLFPNYKAFLKKIQDRDLKITLNLHPAVGVRYFEDMYEEMAKAVGIDPKTEEKVAFDFTSDDFINAYFKILHKPYEHDGVEFWWIDWQQGTKTNTPGLDPLWALNHYHTLDNAKEHAPLILSRYCGIGSHRYPLGFSGDTIITWKSLRYIPYFTAMGTNAGYTWWSHDIGGHMMGFKDDELYARYIQFGVFSPINRLHCSNSRMSTKEPSYYLNGAGLIAEEFLRLRHKMIPFLYSASYRTHAYGEALIEPMYYAYPECADAYKCDGQYMFGGQLLVAHITKKSNSKGLVEKKVWLPEGRWTDIFTGDRYVGGKWVTMVRWKDNLPALAREGGFVVLDGRKYTNSVANPDVLDVMTFNGNGEYELYEDKDGSAMNTHFESSAKDGVQSVEIYADGDLSVMPERTYKLQFRNIPEGEVKVYVDGKAADFDTDIDDFLTVIVEGVCSESRVRVEVAYETTEREYRNKELLYSLRRLEGLYSHKSKIYKDIRDLEDDEYRDAIEQNENFSRIEKNRLLESLE